MNTLHSDISDAKHWAWTLKHDIVQFKKLLGESMSMQPSSVGWTIEQERFFSNQSAQMHALLIDAGNFFKAASRVGAEVNRDLLNKVKHIRNIHEHWEENRKYFTGEMADFSQARASTRWFKINYPGENPFSRGFSNARGYDIAGILNPDELLKEIAATENVIRQKIEGLA